MGLSVDALGKRLLKGFWGRQRGGRGARAAVGIWGGAIRGPMGGGEAPTRLSDWSECV